jgi:predicted nuclease of predicted toxin-antitoxin system
VCQSKIFLIIWKALLLWRSSWKTFLLCHGKQQLPCSNRHSKVLQPMRLLLDECVPVRLRKALPKHHVSTVIEQGWSGIKNGKLLSIAAMDFDALITVDKNLPYQQNVSKLPVAVVVLNCISNELTHLLDMVPALETALVDLMPGSYVLVSRNP